MRDETPNQRRLRKDFDDQRFVEALITIVVQRTRSSLENPFIHRHMKEALLVVLRLAEIGKEPFYEAPYEQMNRIKKALRELPTGEAFVREADGENPCTK
jgi:hypothetical protein